MSTDQLKQILQGIELCQYSNTDIVGKLLYDLRNLRDCMDETEHPGVLSRLELMIMNLEMVDSQNTEVELYLNKYRRLRA